MSIARDIASHDNAVAYGQPGYFEKQEAPAYGVSAVKALGSDLGKKYEEHFKRLYEE